MELALALLIARGGVLTSLLGTVPLTGRQWLIGAAPAVLLFVLWELGKLIARRERRTGAGRATHGGGARRYEQPNRVRHLVTALPPMLPR